MELNADGNIQASEVVDTASEALKRTSDNNMISSYHTTLCITEIHRENKNQNWFQPMKAFS